MIRIGRNEKELDVVQVKESFEALKGEVQEVAPPPAPKTVSYYRVNRHESCQCCCDAMVVVLNVVVVRNRSRRLRRVNHQ